MLKKTLVVSLGCCLWVCSSNTARADNYSSEVFIGYAIAPVPLKLARKNLAERYRIGVGSYLINGPMACAGCHTAPLFAQGGDPFQFQSAVINTAAYLGGGTPFGPFLSRNLTPDKQGRPAGLTLDQFVQVMRHGVDFKAPMFPGDPPLLQVMPWPEYTHTTTESLRSIYEYLSVVPCLEGGPGQAPNRCSP